jgi:regulator of protease activity HflC (stomatin/prohibitin superfamily)
MARIPKEERYGFRDWMSEHKMGLIITTLIVLGIILIMTLISFVSVPAGYKAVITSAPNSNEIGSTLGEGWHFNPYYALCNIELLRYNSQTEEFVGQDLSDDNAGSIAVRSSDNLEIYVDFAVTFHIPSDNVSDVRIQYGNDWKQNTIIQTCRSVPRDTMAQYQALDIIGSQRGVVEQSMRENITHKLESFGFVVDNFALRDIRPPDSVSRAIEDKKVAEQYLITAGYQAQSKIILAQGNLTATLINANASAQAQVIKANGSAEAIQLVMDMFRSQDPNGTNVTLNYLTWLYIQALSDPNSNIAFIIVPQGDGTPILIQTPSR